MYANARKELRDVNIDHSEAMADSPFDVAL